MTATSASRLLLPNSRKALRNSLTVTFNRDSTVSKPADLNMPATAAASFAGFWSRATFLYAELPMTSATRLSAKALTPVVARMAAAKTNERNEITARISPCDRIVGTTPSEQVDFALADSSSDLAHVPPPERTLRRAAPGEIRPCPSSCADGNHRPRLVYLGSTHHLSRPTGLQRRQA